MRLSSIPGLMSICILLTHSSRFILSTGSSRGSNQSSQNESKSGKAPDGSQSSPSPVKPPQARSGTSATHAQSQGNPSGSSQPNVSTPSASSANSSQSHRSSTPSQPRPTSSSATGQSSSSPKLAAGTPKESDKSIDQSASNPASQVRSSTSGARQTQAKPSDTRTQSSASDQSQPTKPKESTPVPKVGKETKKQEKTDSVELNIKLKKGTDQYEYNYNKNTKIATFEAKSDYCFSSVSQDKTKIWETQDTSEYSTKVVTDGEGPSSKKVSIYLLTGTIKNFTKLDKKWSEKSNFLELDVSKTSSTYEFDFQKDDKSKTNTYTTKHGFKFSSVKDNEIVFWRTQDKTQYSNKLIVSEMGSGKKNVTIHLKNGQTRYYRRRKEGYQWLDVTVSDDNEKIPTEVNFSEDKSDEEFEYVKGNNSTASYVAKGNFVFDRVFKPKGSSCCGSDSEIWVAKDKLYANKVVKNGVGTGKSLDKVSVYLTDGTVKNFIEKDSKWSERSNLLELDVSKTSSTYEFDFQKDDKSKTNTYTTKHGFKFSCVKHKEVAIWKSADSKEYSDKVEVKADGSKPKFITVHLKDCTTKCFIKLDNKWFETPASIAVDVSKTSSTDGFDFSKQDKLNTYLPKTGVEFNSVKHKEVEIWKASGESEHSTKVEVHDLGSNKVDLTIHLNDGTTKKFHKAGKKDPWTYVSTSEVSSNDQTPRSQASAQSQSTSSLTSGTPSKPASSVSQPAKVPKANESASSTSGSQQAQPKPSDSKTEVTTPKPSESGSGVSSKPKDQLSSDGSVSSGQSKPTNVSTSSSSSEESQDTKTTPDPSSQPSDGTPSESTPSTSETGDSGGGETGSNPVAPSTSSTSLEHPSKLKITTEISDGDTKENEPTHYELKRYRRYYKFEFRDDIKCKKVVLESDTLYEFGKNEPKDKHPKEIYFNTETNYVYLGLYKTKFVERYEYNDWKCESGTMDKKISASKFKVLTQGSTAENDNTKFDEKNEGSFVKCEFKSGAKSTELKYDNQQAYKHDQTQHGTNYPKCLYFHKHMKVVFLEFEDNVIWLFRFDSDLKSWESEKLEKQHSFDPNKLKVLTPDPTDANKDKENDKDVLDKKTIGSVICYIVKKDVDYFLFKYESNIAISYYNYYRRPKLKEMYFLLNSKKNLALLEDKSLYVLNV